MVEKTKKTVEIKSSRIVENNVATVKTTKLIPVIERRLSSKAIADDITSRITGRLINYPDLFDPKTGRFLTEDELKAKGAVIITVNYAKDIVDEMLKKSRTTKDVNPFSKVIKTCKYQIIANIVWESYVNRRSEHGNFVAADKRSNGIENYEDCKAVGITKAGNHTLNGVAFKVLDETEYFTMKDDNFVKLNKEYLTKEYLKIQSNESKEKEALKHGIDVAFDPKYRTTRIDSCSSIKAFGFEYIPLDNKK
jgi:hypothetical protein